VPPLREHRRATKTVTHLADGRELIYFDDPGAPPRRPRADRRELPSRDTIPELRWDALAGEWVSVAAQRQDRTYLPPEKECPLDASTPEYASEIPDPGYDVVVFENRFPSFATLPSAPRGPLPAIRPGDMLNRAAGRGRCEVVCFTSDHHTAFSGLSPARVRTLLDAWIDRTEQLSTHPDIEQVFIFENRGREIGVTLTHPHGQIYGYPFIAPHLRAQLDQARAYEASCGRNLFADTLAAEVAAGERVVQRGEHWTAFVPFAARWPMEVHLYPNRQVPDLPALTEAELDELSRVYLAVLRRLEAVFDDTLPYIAGWHQAPVRRDRDLAYLHLQVTSTRRAPGKLKYLAGSESAMGSFINDMQPEEVAALLRDAKIVEP